MLISFLGFLLGNLLIFLFKSLIFLNDFRTCLYINPLLISDIVNIFSHSLNFVHEIMICMSSDSLSISPWGLCLWCVLFKKHSFIPGQIQHSLVFFNEWNSFRPAHSTGDVLELLQQSQEHSGGPFPEPHSSAGPAQGCYTAVRQQPCYLAPQRFGSVQFSHLVMSNSLQPHNCSMPGLPVHHQLPESTQTHVHWVSVRVPEKGRQFISLN